MPDGGSQSPITMRLNLLSNYRTRQVEVEREIEDVLKDDTIPTKDIVKRMIDGITIATSPRELEHVQRWPNGQLEILRQVVLQAVRQKRPTFYDWQYENDLPGISVRDNGLAVYVTFRSRPDF
jgi:hypothetical protein